MEYQTFGRTTLFIGLLKNLFHQGGVTVWRNGVGKSFPGIQVNDDTNGINVLLHSSIRDVAHPNFIGGVRIKILLQSTKKSGKNQSVGRVNGVFDTINRNSARELCEF